MKKIKAQKGFTLIELLVVIAIIGLLATIALASLNSARTKAADAAVRANMANIAAQAELYYDTNSSSYGAIDAACAITAVGIFKDPNIAAMVTQAKNSSDGGSAVCTGGAQNWAITVGKLKSGVDAGKYWCVDNSGNKKIETLAAGSTSGVCNP